MRVEVVLLCIFLFGHLLIYGEATGNEAQVLGNFLKSRLKVKPSRSVHSSSEWFSEKPVFPSDYIHPQDGSMEIDKIDALPGQPDGVDFDQYSGYVTVDSQAGRALFYYFAESPRNSSSTNPLVLWLNGGPGCSSLIGAMTELGPFRVNSNRQTLYRNNYAWNNVANVIFLESPAGVGFSYSNTSSDYQHTGDKSAARDAYTFLVNWLERFPQYKSRDFYITGESYAGHYVPQLAYTILLHNRNSGQTIINLKGVAIGNGLLEDRTWYMGQYDYLWTHALNSDETNRGIHTYCRFNGRDSQQCENFLSRAAIEAGDIFFSYNIYAPFCQQNSTPSNSVESYDPCSDHYLLSYLNRAEVQTALHARVTNWDICSDYIVGWNDWAPTVLPIVRNLMASGLRVWIYSGDIDAAVPITSSRYAIHNLKLPVRTAWRPWSTNNEVGGYVEEYQGLTLVTVRGAGHLVPSYQPARALTMISSFLEGVLPPP